MDSRKPISTTLSAGRRLRRRASGQSTLFDFVTDGDLRASLVSDYAELSRSADAKNWKCVHLLTGSILEAVAIDYLISCGVAESRNLDAQGIGLKEALAILKQEGALSDETFDLTTAIRKYRNLIHPGRMLRLERSVTEGSATIVRGVLEQCITEIAASKKKVYGHTAEQVLDKLRIDPASVNILDQVIGGLREYERERLLVHIIPYRYLTTTIGFEGVPKSVLVQCFQRVYDTASDGTRKAAAQFGAEIIRTKGESIVSEWIRSFFRPDHLRHLNPSERQFVKSRVFLKLARETSIELLRTTIGIEDYLNEDEAVSYWDYLLKFGIFGEPDEVKQQAWQRLERIGSSLSDTLCSRFWSRLSDWEQHCRKQKLSLAEHRIGQFRTQSQLSAALKTIAKAIDSTVGLGRQK